MIITSTNKKIPAAMSNAVIIFPYQETCNFCNTSTLIQRIDYSSSSRVKKEFGFTKMPIHLSTLLFVLKAWIFAEYRGIQLADWAMKTHHLFNRR